MDVRIDGRTDRRLITLVASGLCSPPHSDTSPHLLSSLLYKRSQQQNSSFSWLPSFPRFSFCTKYVALHNVLRSSSSSRKLTGVGLHHMIQPVLSRPWIVYCPSFPHIETGIMIRRRFAPFMTTVTFMVDHLSLRRDDQEGDHMATFGLPFDLSARVWEERRRRLPNFSMIVVIPDPRTSPFPLIHCGPSRHDWSSVWPFVKKGNHEEKSKVTYFVGQSPFKKRVHGFLWKHNGAPDIRRLTTYAVFFDRRIFH